MDTLPDETTIDRPGDQDHVDLLRIKCTEYEARLAANPGNLDAFYKLFILAHLLDGEGGRVAPLPLQLYLQSRYGRCDQATFDNAWSVICQYVQDINVLRDNRKLV
jgi:hypothetical protein